MIIWQNEFTKPINYNLKESKESSRNYKKEFHQKQNMADQFKILEQKEN